VREGADKFAQAYSVSPDVALTRFAADASGALLLERACRSIFGSQVEVIETLRDHGGSAEISALRPIYDAAVALAPPVYQNYRFEQWLQFLANWGLVDLTEHRASLTAEGAALIPYMLRRGYSIRPPH
jgi:hypothetical protein